MILIFLLIILGCSVNIQPAIIGCDFETDCKDFNADYNWGLTDGSHPKGINHDHTLNNSSGHYLFYTPSASPPFYTIKAEIKTNDWLELSADRAVCFRVWYYTPRMSQPFYIELLQGYDEALTRLIASIPGKDPSTDDWALINLTLPAEKFKIAIRLNISSTPLVFDDFSVDYCDGPPPAPPKTMFLCDFESSCSDDFISLPDYPNQWSIMTASDAIQIENRAPSIDSTYRNKSGHYAFIPLSKQTEKGNVGYLSLKTLFNITTDRSFCLNFQYYYYGLMYSSNLKVYALLSDSLSTHQIWPPIYSQIAYNKNTWTWAITNLPIGYYSILFRIDNTDDYILPFALDDISIVSCDYPASTFVDDVGFLSFSCDFDNLTLCGMQNGDRFIKTSFNFSVFTGETVPNKQLGPLRDHTSNSTSGGFVYWDRQLPYVIGDSGIIHPSNMIESNLGMCIRFAYYVKSSMENVNATSLYITSGGCYAATLWSIALDDSQGWQVQIVPAPERPCRETFYFGVNQMKSVRVSVAFDDISIEQCKTLIPTTTTSTTTTSTTSVTTTTTTTTQSTTTTTTQSTTTTTSQTTTTDTSTTSTTSTSTTTTTTRMNSSAHTISFMNECIIVAFLFIVNQMFSFV